jgi:hypothetical protein
MTGNERRRPCSAFVLAVSSEDVPRRACFVGPPVADVDDRLRAVWPARTLRRGAADRTARRRQLARLAGDTGGLLEGSVFQRL